MKSRWKIYFLAFIFIFTGRNYCGAQAWEWAVNHIPATYFADISAIPGYGVVTGGKVFGEGLIVKYDDNGISEWEQHVFGLWHDYVKCVVLDSSGNTYVAGDIASPFSIIDSVTFMHPNYWPGSTFTTRSDIFVAKLNSSGNLLWVKVFGAQGHDTPIDMIRDPLGGVIIAANNSHGPILLDTFQLNFSSSAAIFFRLDSAGTVTWANSVLNYFNPEIALEENNNLYSAGTFIYPQFVFGSDTLINAGDDDIALLKWDSTGSPEWAISFQGPDEDLALGICIDNNGNIYTAGRAISDMDANGMPVSTNNGHMFLIKTDPSGTTQWTATHGGPNIDNAFGKISCDLTGISVICGFSSLQEFIIGSDTIINCSQNFSQEQDGIIANFDFNGQYQNVFHVCGYWHERCINMVRNNAGLYVCGIQQSTATTFYPGGAMIFSPDTTYRSYVSKVNWLLSGNPEIEKNEFSLFPNPASNKITIKSAIQSPVQVIISDVTGKVVTTKYFTSGTFEMNTSLLENGLYLITLIDNTATVTKRLLIQK